MAETAFVQDGTPAIATEKLTKRFGSFVALDRLDLEVRRGEVFGYLGPNGAGKSTTLRLLLGLIRPSAGRADIFGVDVGAVRRVHEHIAYVPGDVALWPRLTGGQCLELFGRLHGSVDAGFRDSLVERFQLDPSKRARAYSKGNRQKVALVAAFATRADLILLDEPTSGLDPLIEAEFVKVVREVAAQGRTVFLSSHILAEVETLCERVGILREGRLVEVADVSKLRTMHGTELEVDFDGPVPDLSQVPGVAGIDSTPGGVRVQLSDEPGPLLRALAPAKVTALRSREASLEEIFLGYYAADDDADNPDGTGDGARSGTRDGARSGTGSGTADGGAGHGR